MSTHEDDSWRAVMTAVTISQHMAGAGLPNKIGVTTGEAFCGNVGSHKRCEYALYGEGVEGLGGVEKRRDGKRNVLQSPTPASH